MRMGTAAKLMTLSLLGTSTCCHGFSLLPQNRNSCHRYHPHATGLFNEKFNRDIEERSRQRAQGEGGGEMAAGAILGGLLGGPFGTILVLVFAFCFFGF